MNITSTNLIIMGHSKISKNETEYVIANVMEDVENVDAREYLIHFHAKSIYPVIKEMVMRDISLDEKYKELGSIVYASFILAKEETEKLSNVELPDSIKNILMNDLSKKEQINLLKGVSISAEQLGAIFIYANDNGYKFSNYRFAGTPKKYVGSELPSFVHLKEDGIIEHYGETSLTDGQMKEIVNTSQFVLARILNNGEHWHCFFQTRRGLLGEEPGEYGSKSHIHYISDSFGVTLEDVIKGFKGGVCPHSKVHIILN